MIAAGYMAKTVERRGAEALLPALYFSRLHFSRLHTFVGAGCQVQLA
jgi:hypothetical protein